MLLDDDDEPTPNPIGCPSQHRGDPGVCWLFIFKGRRAESLTGLLQRAPTGAYPVCVECLIGKQKKPILFKVTEPSSIPYRTRSRSLRLRLVSVTHCNLPQDQILLKCLKLNSTSCVQYGSFQKSECFRFPQGSPSELNTPCYAYQSQAAASQTQNLGAAALPPTPNLTGCPSEHRRGLRLRRP